MVVGSFFERLPDRYSFWAGQSAEGYWFQHVSNRWLDVFGRWDSMFYVSIAESGYPPMPADGGYLYHSAFFPLYPSLMRGLTEVVPGMSTVAAGALLSNVCFFLGVWLLYRWVSMERSDASARATVLALLVFPTSHFMSVVYSEATAFLLAMVALHGARTGRPALASLAAGAGLWVRPTGWVVCVAMAVELLTQRRSWMWLLIPAAALSGVLLLNFANFGDAFAFVRVQAGWGRSTSFPLSSLFDTRRGVDHHLFALAGLALLGLAIKQRERLSLLAFSALNLLVPLSTGSIQSMPRFVMSNFPLSSALGRWAIAQSPRLRRALVAGGLVGLSVYSFRWGAAFPPN